MTQPVKFTDEAIEGMAAWLYARDWAGGPEPWTAPHSDGFKNRYRASARAALEAALPYLALAEPCPTCNGREWINGQWVARRETVDMVCQTCGHDYAPAVPQSAEEGGLRAALEALHKPYTDVPGHIICNAEEDNWPCATARLLAEHPADAAVPQPVDREALEMVLHDHYYDAGWSREHQGFRCVCGWLGDDHVQHAAEQVLALLSTNGEGK